MDMGVDKINARNWELLMYAVEEKRVVPIIGDNLIRIAMPDGECVNVREYVLKKLSEHFESDTVCKGYSQVEDLIREYNRRQRNAGDVTDIYYEIYDILNKATVVVPDFVKRLFHLCRFPLVLTTSFVRGIDGLLGIQADKIKVYNKKASADIKLAELDGDDTMLYYLFGRLSMAKRSFKVTEDDLLDYLHCWHNSDTRPTKLGEYLSDKFLLVLGCDYPNWLFRFFWHSIKNFTIVPSSADMQGVVTVSAERADSDGDLMNFLSRVQTSVYRKAEDFINEFNERYEARHSLEEASSFFGGDTVSAKEKDEAYDIFISYASEDYELAGQVAQKFKSLGASVWFDKVELNPGEKYEMSIAQKIQECKRFVPILSQATLKEGRRYFKKEWKQAIEEAEYRLNEPYISPIVIDGIDPFSERGIPVEFTKEAHIIYFRDENFETQVKKIIRSFR